MCLSMKGNLCHAYIYEMVNGKVEVIQSVFEKKK